MSSSFNSPALPRALSQRLRLAGSIWRNRRITDYAAILDAAISSGYRISGVSEFVRSASDDSGGRLILRHDVDTPHQGVAAMLAAERQRGVRATWYFRWSTCDTASVEAVRAAGGEIGFHYETLATVLTERGIHTAEQVTPEILTEARTRLAEEIDRFKRRFHLGEISIASHGHPHNQQVRLANHILVDDELRKSSGILAEAYDDSILRRVDCYVSDTTPLVNDGWAYNFSAMQGIRAGRRVICFLSHPEHWDLPTLPRIRTLTKALLRGPRHVNRTFQPDYAKPSTTHQ